ncbi:DUF5106 domain-containing protein [Bacteroides ihuae]|uniref:DUF5106 domain-containing protein n=1 Tax=Bacteroides ihuae TaxID=1852362 RepID=UPI000B27AF82|nr:DUF5106 domain-containing protein [Bacteroides ihuae]
MMTSMKYIFLFALICLCSCKNGKVSGQESTKDSLNTKAAFTLPTIPAMLTTPEQRSNYLVKHYWDNFDFTDTSYIHRPEITEQAWVDYIDLLKYVTLPTTQSSVKELMIKAGSKEKKVFMYFTELADKYFYDPNSPMRNEEFYIPVLETMIATPILSKAEKIRPQARLELAHKNRIGTPAINFTYTLLSGARGTLHGLSAEYTLLFFNNPGCHACEENIKGIKGSSIINQLIAEKRLKLLAVYPDEELDEWKRHLKEFPQEWINGYDRSATIKTKNIYDLKAIPTLYLLDKGKKVLLKDANLPDIETYLQKEIN